MYKPLLIFKYLRRKIAPLFAMLAVTLCCAMVIIVISVMGGFLDMMAGSLQKLESDVTIHSSLRGFEHYQELVDAVGKLPQVRGAAVTIQAFGLMSVNQDSVPYVQIVGIKPASFNQVTTYKPFLHWKKQAVDQKDTLTDLQQLGMTFKAPKQWGNQPGLVMGIAINPYHYRDHQGAYDFNFSMVGKKPVTVTFMAISAKGSARPVPRQFQVVNEYKSGVHEIDNLRVFVDFDVAQKILRMDRFEGEDEAGNPMLQRARASSIIIKGKEGVSLNQLKEAVTDVARDVLTKYPTMGSLGVTTWREKHATFIGAVEKEKMMMTFLFAFISLVAVAMIGVVFYMIVMEKTHDIGVLRAMGASASGIAGIFLGYGLAIGLVGSLLGLGLAALIVNNLNAIQAWLTVQFGFTMWDPQIYFFDRIPAKLDPVEVSLIMAVSICSGLVGAIIPALMAGFKKPVEALRYE